MSDFLKIASTDAKKEADIFIRRIKNGIIKKRILSNVSEEYPVDKAFQSFKHFSKSSMLNNAMKRAYHSDHEE